ncbi:outer membrane beta-barrel protein [Terrimonas rubra]|uniref:Outer membrane beta-barrel protein n=1 Tax=Terrimonas rubra TaxID=1035890 RepID=A0ABW6A1S5_9BACT
MNKLLLTVSMMIIVTNLAAQKKLYISGGANISSFKKEGAGIHNYVREFNPGFQLGINYQQYQKTKPGFFSGAAQLVMLPVKYDRFYEDAGRQKNSRPIYLQLSPNIGLRSNLFKNMGLYGAIGAYMNVLVNFQKSFNYVNAGLSGSAGIDLSPKWQIAGDYLFGFTDLLSGKQGPAHELFVRSVQLSLRYKVFEQRNKKAF